LIIKVLNFGTGGAFPNSQVNQIFYNGEYKMKKYKAENILSIMLGAAFLLPVTAIVSSL
jgi:hypothetical protein